MTSETTTTPLLQTKLHRPKIIGDHVHRTRLIERLDQRHQRPLTLVTAPAGYGKSTLASCWLETSGLDAAWISLDETDNDFHLFLSYLVAAVQSLSPTALNEIQTILYGKELPPLPILAGILINELDQIKQAFVLTLDDYHVIHNKVIHDLIAELLKYPPNLMHLVILSRIDPPLPLVSLRAKSNMTEIRLQDLRFSIEETDEYLKKMFGREIEESVISLVNKKTEGWVTGLRLAALSVRHSEKINHVLSNLPNDGRYVNDYMVEEVLSQQPQSIQMYLLKTSILDRFSAPLSQIVSAGAIRTGTDQVSGREFLDWLLEANLFLIPLDDEHKWFRFHHLFQDILQRLLRRRFSPDEIDMLHREAGAWFADNKLIEEALNHFLASGDSQAAAELIAQHRHDFLNSEQWRRLERLIRMLPANSIKNNPDSLLLKAWLCESGVRLEELRSYLKKVEPLLTNTVSKTTPTLKSLSAELDALRAFIHYIDGEGERAVQHALQSLKYLIPQAYYVRLWAQCLLALGYQMTGDLKKAYDVAYNALKEDVPDSVAYHSRVFIILGFLNWISADLNGLKIAATQSLSLCKNSDVPESISSSHYFLGIAHYHRNELEKANKELEAVVKKHYKASTLNFAHSAFALSLSYQAQGRLEKTRELVKTIIDRAVETKSGELLQLSEAFQAELALREGSASEAQKWVENFNPHPFHPGYRFYVPQITLAKFLLVKNTSESLQRATDLLSDLYDYYSSIHNTRFLIDVLILQALIHDSRGDEVSALAKLTEAIAQAEPGRFIRPFLDMGPPMADLLKRLAQSDAHLKYIGIIIKAFREERSAVFQSTSSSQTPAVHSLPNSGPVESLTKRELEIMTLLAQRLSNKEIAEKLFLSTKTVKAHLYNIYQKLNVSTRRQAVDKGDALGLIATS